MSKFRHSFNQLCDLQMSGAQQGVGWKTSLQTTITPTHEHNLVNSGPQQWKIGPHFNPLRLNFYLLISPVIKGDVHKNFRNVVEWPVTIAW